MAKLTIPEEEHFTRGHTGCPGCGASLAMRYVLKALGQDTIVSIPACCWAVMPGVFPYSHMKIPMAYSAFETTGASISGIRAALDSLGRGDTTVLGFAGDGGTFDIGIQALSGAVERQENVIYVCYDNEAYMNTGIQRSSATPIGAWTTTTQVGKAQDWEKTPKKNITDMLVAHKIPYVATASIAYPEDVVKKVTKAKSIKGPKFIHLYATCPTGWKMDPARSVEVAKIAVQANIFPLYEVENGVYTISRKPAKPTDVVDYLRMQGRFRHMSGDQVERFRDDVNKEWQVLLKKEKFTHQMAEELGGRIF